jgi:hypothetical protein
VRHLAGIKSLAAELGQGHNRVACRATASLAGRHSLDVMQQFGTARRINQGHVALVNAH